MAGRRGDRTRSHAQSRSVMVSNAVILLDQRGPAGLTASQVIQASGLPQSSFYACFAGVQDLLEAVVAHLETEHVPEYIVPPFRVSASVVGWTEAREAWHVMLGWLDEHPEVFRLVLRSRQLSITPLVRWGTRALEQRRSAVLQRLELCDPQVWQTGSGGRQRTMMMVADGVIALNEALAVGYLEGRYTDVEEMTDVLMALGSSSLLAPETARTTLSVR